MATLLPNVAVGWAYRSCSSTWETGNIVFDRHVFVSPGLRDGVVYIRTLLARGKTKKVSCFESYLTLHILWGKHNRLSKIERSKLSKKYIVVVLVACLDHMDSSVPFWHPPMLRTNSVALSFSNYKVYRLFSLSFLLTLQESLQLQLFSFSHSSYDRTIDRIISKWRNPPSLVVRKAI